eukprot:scaffold17056_cov102-Isochrysis_galbana.AAC.3
MAGNPHITAIDLRGNGFDADGLYALVQVNRLWPFLRRDAQSACCRSTPASVALSAGRHQSARHHNPVRP